VNICNCYKVDLTTRVAITFYKPIAIFAYFADKKSQIYFVYI